MIVKNYTFVRDNFRDMINKVNEDRDTITITTKDHNAVLMSEDDYDAIMETLYLQQNPANAKRLASSIENLERGKGKTVTINESSSENV
ncbi:type II toxin-antitoxin system prevent-host-death family antitoxin [Staphylococcus equorum]|uniref:Antitoxin n=1 Tax=Staphylococcus equorum TaxID=246432 RepID=A0A9X4L3A3_9STAP|nr:type II toxin-antitoxin system prevent-host-death family antitoxin [Staphylococcus equorum]MDG0819710.1 type II toxin-antitoxin system prevent-host-death family antitoxin [Staphylococcus equorum]MDG0840351.1 type II toxin-antitoxin system prevent-host-death family antitoxin [Staphylococcus equorum]MDG0846034.1 type II toxin-antitoxin system prevent-host-death family antitoxin [Staphylococcus equorum]